MINYDEICHVDIPEGTSGIWKVEKFTFPENDADAFVIAMTGRPVTPGKYTRLMRWTRMSGGNNWKVVMSDVPPEIKDHYKVLQQAQTRGGKVLINGLGLGMVLKGILSFPNVTHVDVVELDSDVIKLVAPTYNTGPRVTIYHGDAFNMEWAKGARWNVVWHDIWDEILPDNLPGMKRLHTKYSELSDWQDSWCRFECRLGY